MIEVLEPRFLWPPRPEKAVSRELIGFYERRGWIAQIKKNGTCSTVRTYSGGDVEYWTRHDAKHLAWAGNDEINKFFSCFKDSYFVFELLHSKGGGVRDHAYVFDVLKLNGRSLEGTTLRSRLATLSKIAPMTKRVEIAKTYDSGLTALYDNLSYRDSLSEGIVMKDPDATLQPCYKEGLNSTWQVKCRLPAKLYSF